MGDEEARRASAWRFVRAIVRAQSYGVSGAVLSGLLWQTGAVAAPLVVKYAIDHGIVPHDHGALRLWLIVLGAVGLLEVCAGAFRHLYAIRNRAHTDARVRDAIFAHALRLDAAYHDQVGPGELLSRASSDSLHVARMMDAIGHTIGYALTVSAVAVVMLILDWHLALIVLVPVPFVSVGAWLYSRRYERGTRQLQESWAEASTLVEETVSGVRVVKGLGAGDALSATFRGRSAEIKDRALHLARLDAIFIPVLEALPLLGIATVLWFGGRSVIDGGLTVGSFVAFNAYVVMLVWPLRVLGQRVTTVQKALAASGRITEVLEAEPQLLEPRHPVELEQPVRGDIRLDGVLFGHAGDRPVLDGLDLNVSTATTCASFGSRTCAARWRSFSRRPSSSARACARTSASAGPRRATRTCGAPPSWPAPRRLSPACPTATRRCSESGASRSPAASGSASRSRGRSSPTRPCSCSTTRPRRSTRPRSTRSARRSPR